MAGPAGRVRARSIRPAFNVFSLLDHLTGRYIRGKDGAWYLNGGYSHIMAFGGRGNTFKSALSGVSIATVSLRYEVEYTDFYDSEISLQVSRIDDYINTVCFNNHWDPEKFNFTELTFSETTPWNHSAADSQPGDEWWRDSVRNEIPERRKLKPNKMRETPFKELDGSYAMIPNPWLFNVDSLSEMHVKAVEDMYQKRDVGAADMTTEAMKDAGTKAQLIKQMPVAAAQGGFYFGLIAHADDELKMDMYAPSTKKLDGLKGNLKFKGVPGRGFTFLTNNCLLAVAIGNGLGKDKYAQYPHPDDQNPKIEQTDLRIIKFIQLRGKSGPTGECLDLVFSQKEGLQVGVTEFHFLQEVCKGWGMESSGSGGAFKQLHIYPEVKFTRKTLRQHIRDDAKFARALSITASLCYIIHNWFDLEQNLKITAQELYDGIKAEGYDWDQILGETVEYWYFNDQEKSIGKPTITVMTLLQAVVNKVEIKKLKREKPAKAA